MSQLDAVDVTAPLAWSEPGRTTVEIETGAWRTRQPLYVETTAPCRAACPAGEPIAHWIARARAGDYPSAWRLIREENPFPAVLGRVCAHPCERACHRGALDGAVSINALERFVGDWGLRHGTVESAPHRAEHVAVVGGGPAGLAGAYHLARFGYQVTIFEAERELGGVLRYGIPAYRLPRAVVDREIELILALGIAVETGRRVEGAAWDRLDAWDAVFVATGAGTPVVPDMPGARARNVVDGLAFLRDVNTGARPTVGPRVVVVGGGSSAMDVARTARRLGGASVTVLALEPREAMPAIADEVEQALAEGVEIRNRAGVRRLVERDGVVSAVVAAPARLARHADGTIAPAFEDGVEAVLPVDTVVLALGQRADLGVLPPALHADAGILAITTCGGTSRPRVFAGGDVATRARTVAHAVGAGARAARAIHARLSSDVLRGPQLAPAWTVARPDHVVAPTEIALHTFPRARRAVRWDRLPSARVASFVEVVDGLDENAARAESERCFTCGHCIGCDTCFLVCPDVAIAKVDGGYCVSTAHCKGCGLCARECPRGALQMAAER